MPELPEVETIRRALEPAVRGGRIEAVTIFDPRLTQPVPTATVEKALRGSTIEAVERWGKYLVFRLGESALLVHLRMTGVMLLNPDPEPVHPHRRALFSFDNGTMEYRDARRFGTFLHVDRAEADRYLALRLGPDPLGDEFTVAHFQRAVQGRRSPIKSVMLDQRVIAGMGNIYADEALFGARIDPRTPASVLSKRQITAIHAATRTVLGEGVARAGVSMRDYRTPSGGRGSMQSRLKVYGRATQPCVLCGKRLARETLSGRSTTFCEGCQSS